MNTRKKKGFNPPSQDGRNWRHVAVELNLEDISNGLDEAEVIELLRIHHLVIAPVQSKADKRIIEAWSDQICSVYLSATEFLAEIYVDCINDYAVELGANVARVYHNSHLGDTRIHANSIGHVFYPIGKSIPLPKAVIAMKDKYVCLKYDVDGKDVTLRNRLGN